MSVKEERRLHVRRQVSFPAYFGAGNQQAILPATIVDISPAGLRLAVKTSDFDATEGEPVNILFALPGDKAPIKMQCSAVRTKHAGEKTELGISFKGCHFLDHERVRNYLRL